MISYVALPIATTCGEQTIARSEKKDASLSIARAKMAMITAELKISQASKCRLPPATNFTHAPCDEVNLQSTQAA